MNGSCPPETNMAMEHLQSLIRRTSSDGCFSIVILVYLREDEYTLDSSANWMVSMQLASRSWSIC